LSLRQKRAIKVRVIGALGWIVDKLRALRYFRRTAELNSFTDAAREFEVPASSISRRIKDLEGELGIELLQRTTRNVKTTELGSVYYNMISEVLQKLDDADELICQGRDALKGRVQISVSPSYGEKVLLPVLQAFQQAYPDIVLDLDFSDKLVNFNHSSVDIVIRAGQALDEHVMAKRLANSEVKLVATPKYLANLKTRFGKTVFTTEDISSSDILQYRSSKGIPPWWHYNDGDWQKLSIKPIMSSNNAAALLASSLAHRGLAIFPLWLIKDELANGYLVEVQTTTKVSNYNAGELSFNVLYQKAKYQIPKIKHCVDFIVEHLS